MKRSFFRWTPTAIFLWLASGFFALAGLINIWLIVLAAQGSLEDVPPGYPKPTVRSLVRGSVENAAVVLFCLMAWSWMRKHTAGSLRKAAVAVLIALLITATRWLSWQLKGTNPLNWFEPLLIWPLLVYAILFAYQESRRTPANSTPQSQSS
jgi:hypothetical protein